MAVERQKWTLAVPGERQISISISDVAAFSADRCNQTLSVRKARKRMTMRDDHFRVVSSTEITSLSVMCKMLRSCPDSLAAEKNNSLTLS